MTPTPPPPPLTATDLRATPNPLARHYSRFGVADGLVLTGHSHQAWPDVALEGQVEAFDDAAAVRDDKWDRALAKADEVRAGYRGLLGEPDGEIALAASTHELVVRFLSALDLRERRPRVVTTGGEFHSLRRQLLRLAEEGVEVVWVDVDPVDTLAERLADATDEQTLAVTVSAVLFETARIVPDLGELAAACARSGVELLVDAYHALGCVPFPIHELGLSSAWVTGGGYKYLQLGEGNAFLRLPDHAVDVRPILTGWFAEFGARSQERHVGAVGYAPGAERFAGGTYDPTSNYRAARVFRFFAEQGLTPDLLRESYLHQVGLLAEAFDALQVPDALVTRDRVTPPTGFGGFLALESPEAESLDAGLRRRGVSIDRRGHFLRLGPAPYLSDTQLEAAIDLLGKTIATL